MKGERVDTRSRTELRVETLALRSTIRGGRHRGEEVDWNTVGNYVIRTPDTVLRSFHRLGTESLTVLRKRFPYTPTETSSRV